VVDVQLVVIKCKLCPEYRVDGGVGGEKWKARSQKYILGGWVRESSDALGKQAGSQRCRRGFIEKSTAR
jgi:hypothetical protein